MLGCPPELLRRAIARLGSGDFAPSPQVSPAGADTVLAWVQQAQRRLSGLNLQHFRAIVDSSDDAIVSKTSDGVITSWNAGAERIFGYAAAEVLGRPITLLIPPERVHEEPEILARIARGERVDHFETVRLRKSGEPVDVSVTVSPIRDRSGRVVGASKIARDITRAKRAEAQIRQLAFYDTLTGLPNRRLLQERLAHAQRAMKRRSTACALLFIDLDGFKALNDTHGHDVGDRVLQEVARRLSACVRSEDTVARFGGDEFVVLLENAGPDAERCAQQAELVARKLLAALARPCELDGIGHACTPSIGIALATDPEIPADVVLKQADVAMYEAKRAGRNTLRFFGRGPTPGLSRQP